MKIHSLRIRRSVTLAGAVAALILGFAAIQAAAAWSASAAPLAASPASAKSIEARLLDEQARSAGRQSRRITAESTFGGGVNAPGGTVKPQDGDA